MITGCGLVREAYRCCNSSLLLINCSNVDIHQVNFEANKYTAVYFVNMDGHMKLEVHFIKNQQLQDSSQYKTKSFPGGLLAHFENTLDITGDKLVNLFITNCTFEANNAPDYYEFVSKLKPELEDWTPYGLGGAVGMIFMNDVHGIDIKISGTKFVNNTGTWEQDVCVSNFSKNLMIIPSMLQTQSLAKAMPPWQGEG